MSNIIPDVTELRRLTDEAKENRDNLILSTVVAAMKKNASQFRRAVRPVELEYQGLPPQALTKEELAELLALFEAKGYGVNYERGMISW